MKGGKVVIYRSQRIIENGYFTFKLIDTLDEISEIAVGQTQVLNGHFSGNVEFSPMNNIISTLGYINMKINFGINKSEVTTDVETDECQDIQVHEEVQPCPPPMIYKFSEPKQIPSKIESEDEYNDETKFSKLLIDKLVQSFTEEIQIKFKSLPEAAQSKADECVVPEWPSSKSFEQDNISTRPFRINRKPIRFQNQTRPWSSTSIGSESKKRPSRSMRPSSSITSMTSSTRGRQCHMVASGTYDRYGQPTLKPVYYNSSCSLPRVKEVFYSPNGGDKMKHFTCEATTQTTQEQATQTQLEKRVQLNLNSISEIKPLTKECAQQTNSPDCNLRQQTVISCDINKKKGNPLSDSQISNHSHVTSIRISLPTGASIDDESKGLETEDYSDAFSSTESSYEDSSSRSPIENIQFCSNITDILQPIQSTSPRIQV